MTPLPPGFLTRPFAHRALHGPGVSENSLEAIEAAAEVGWGIEIDVQLTSDGAAVVFHDYVLGRLTDRPGAVRERTLEAMEAIPLLKGGAIPSLADALAAVAGRVPVVVEVKDQSSDMSATGIGPLERAVADAARDYDGPLAVMSFNPHAVAALRDHAPDLPRGLTTCGWTAEDWPNVAEARRDQLRRIDAGAVGASFVSHDRTDLASPEVARVKALGLPVLCWTIRSPDQAAEALAHADQITFEGYTPPL